ncbi:MAG: sigma-54 dependent transcriptional regulator [Tannerellaceae bacterium]|jgi:DNA-binding NtrC family response regulator|nr:sigma-54 dependent transcriptional regulator [Tannerellaceae bacterium]
MKTILVVDDNKSILIAVRMLLETRFEKVITLSSPNRIISTLREEKADAVLLDMNFSAGINTGNEGLFWLSEIKKRQPSLPVVLFTAYADIGLAVRGIKEGAADFIVKPWDNDQLLDTIQKYTSSHPQPSGRATVKASESNGMFWGESDDMSQLRLMIEKVARTDVNILITGENGTGKEILAREIHDLSRRSRSPMVAVDMGAVTETLFESELFGHVRGAFTDARADRQGKFEAADHGTLFLDEIGNLPFHLQAKLLTALQSRTVVRVGSNSPMPVDIRLISATNKDLKEMVARSLFREDLLYRINTIHVEIPPLRKRPGDIIPLAEMFLSRYAAVYGRQTPRLSNSAAAMLMEQPWTGNIRELQHTIEKAVIISEGDTLEAASFGFPHRKVTPPPSTSSTQVKEAATLEEMEYNMIRSAMDTHKGNLSLVAAQLGISRQTLYNKIKRYEL